eukprot:XP_016663504.1 PREDICTED: uncharacterized protein LOC100575412 isoform X2 [Acyrthosiphon pisum]
MRILFGNISDDRVVDFVRYIITKKTEFIILSSGGSSPSAHSKMFNKINRDLPDYNFTFKDWRIGRGYPTFQPDKCVINEIMHIYEKYKFPKNQATIPIKELPDQLTQSKRELDEQIENLPDGEVRSFEILEEPLHEGCRNQERKLIDTGEQSKLLNSVVAYKINMKCKKILLEYEQLQNLNDIIYSLSEDDSSIIFTRYEEFVKNMSLITLDSPIAQASVAGNIFAELLSKNILSMTAITQGIDDVLKYWNDFLMDFPQFFTYIAAIIAPLLLSQNGTFDFNSLKDSCTSIRPDNSSKLLIEVLYKINSSKEALNIKEEKLGGILWIYNKWNALENVPLEDFVPNNQINNYFKKDQIGVFLLSIAIYDKMRFVDNKLLYNILQSWICANINAEIIKTPQFVQALTIAIVIVCLKLNPSYEDFFDSVHLKLLTCYIQFESLPEYEIKEREVKCMLGIQIMSATLKHPGGMVSKLFNKLYEHRVIRKESFELFIKEYEKIADK